MSKDSLITGTNMIAYIEGRILEKTETSCVLVTHQGVGYEIYIPSHTLYALPKKGEETHLYTSLVVREDAQELFGFDSWDERETFRMLITINRVGARTALAILSQFRPNDLRQIVVQDDMLALTKVSGIGKQTGQKIFLELKYKMKGDDTPIFLATNETSTIVYKDALTGLLNLGYEESQLAKILKEILTAQPDLDVSGALRAALKALAQKK